MLRSAQKHILPGCIFSDYKNHYHLIKMRYTIFELFYIIHTLAIYWRYGFVGVKQAEANKPERLSQAFQSLASREWQPENETTDIAY